MDWSSIFGGIGSIAGGAAKGAQSQRKEEADSLLDQQALRQQAARDAYSAQSGNAQFEREGQDRQRRQQILAQLLNNTQDQKITPGNPAIAGRMPTVTGGARPSNLTTNREALMALLSAPEIATPEYKAAPEMTLPKAGTMEKVMGGVAGGSSILSLLGKSLGLFKFLGGGGNGGSESDSFLPSGRVGGADNINSGLYNLPGNVDDPGFVYRERGQY